MKKSPRKADRSGYYIVRPGDTLNKIARSFGQSPDDIASWNSLANRNDLKVGQELRVQPADESGGAQTSAVATGSGVEVRPLEAVPRQPTLQADTSIAPKEEEGITWMWPADGRIVATFRGASKGIDITGNPGQKVLASADGKVLYANPMRGYGNIVIVKHSDSLLSAYAHNQAVLVKEGAIVTRGQQIAEMGKSDSDTVKLHLEIRRHGKPVDPARYLPVR